MIDSVLNMKSALQKTSLSLGINLRFNLYKKYLGLPFEEIMNKMGITRDIQKIKKLTHIFQKKNISEIKIKDKHLIQLKKLKKDFDFAVFTSKDKARTNLILKRYNFFKYIVSSDDVRKGKPNKEGVIKILKKM